MEGQRFWDSLTKLSGIQHSAFSIQHYPRSSRPRALRPWPISLTSEYRMRWVRWPLADGGMRQNETLLALSQRLAVLRACVPWCLPKET